MPSGPEASHPKSIWIFGGLFALSLSSLFLLYLNLPDFDENEKKLIKLPRNIEDAKLLGSLLNDYKEKSYYLVMSGICIVYIFLQTFAIPGSIFLSILFGFLFPSYVALILVCFCSATGASCCYGLSKLVGRRLLNKYFPEKVNEWSAKVVKQRNNLLNYIIFLRITPFLPNWFINIASPVVGVPLLPFFFGTFIGVAPPSFIAIQTGTTLNLLTTHTTTVSWNSIFVLFILSLVSLFPVVWKDALKDKFS